MKYLLVLAILGFQVQAMAWNGTWTGSVVVTNTQGQEAATDTVTITHDDATLTFRESFFGWGFTLAKNNGQLLLNNNVIGTYTADGWQVSWNVSADCVQAYTFAVSGSQVAFSDRYDCTSGSFVYVEGTLTHTPAVHFPPAKSYNHFPAKL
jgi:hypothetical protein